MINNGKVLRRQSQDFIRLESLKIKNKEVGRLVIHNTYVHPFVSSNYLDLCPQSLLSISLCRLRLGNHLLFSLNIY